jgi:hypothetical protein
MIDEQVSQQLLSFARDNDHQSIKRLLEMKCAPTTYNRMGQSALHIGAMWGSIEACQVLCNAGADPNWMNQLRGSTPLHAAALGRGPLEKRVECVKVLIKAKGNPRQADKAGTLPMDQCDDDETLRCALGAAPLVLHKAVEARSSKALSQGLGGGHDVNAQNSKGETALHQAVADGWREGIQVLLVAKASLLLEDDLQQFPLHKAALRGDPRLVELLLGAKSNANAQDRDPDHNPMYSAKKWRREAILSSYGAPLCSRAGQRLSNANSAAEGQSRPQRDRFSGCITRSSLLNFARR